MNKNTQFQMVDFFVKNGIKDFVGVPDSTLKHFISYLIKKNKIIISTREDEAIGIAAGISMSGVSSLVFMQNAGFANSLSTITSLIDLYQIPILFLIGWRGYLKNDAPEHEKIGKIQPKLIKNLELSSRIINDKNWKGGCRWALKKISKNKSCALIIRREFVD